MPYTIHGLKMRDNYSIPFANSVDAPFFPRVPDELTVSSFGLSLAPRSARPVVQCRPLWPPLVAIYPFQRLHPYAYDRDRPREAHRQGRSSRAPHESGSSLPTILKSSSFGATVVCRLTRDFGPRSHYDRHWSTAVVGRSIRIDGRNRRTTCVVRRHCTRNCVPC